MTSLFEMLFSVAHATTTIDLTAGPLSEATNQGPAGFIKGLYLYSLGIVGAAATIMIVYGGVKYVVSGGNEAAKKDAMDILWNSIFGILLLFGAVVILNTINPELTSLKNPDMDIAPTPSTPSSTTPSSTQALPENLKQAASALIASGASLSGNGDCGYNSSAVAIVNDMSNGNYPLVCSPSCSCAAGGTSGTIAPTLSLLQALTTVWGNRPNGSTFSITSLTGGKHSTNSGHYSGHAVDVVPGGSDAASWDQYVQLFYGQGGTPYCECNGNLYSDCQNSQCFPGGKKVSGTHLHIAF